MFLYKQLRRIISDFVLILRYNDTSLFTTLQWTFFIGRDWRNNLADGCDGRRHNSLINDVELCGSGGWLPYLRWIRLTRDSLKPDGATLGSTIKRVVLEQYFIQLVCSLQNKAPYVLLDRPCHYTWSVYLVIQRHFFLWNRMRWLRWCSG